MEAIKTKATVEVLHFDLILFRLPPPTSVVGSRNGDELWEDLFRFLRDRMRRLRRAGSLEIRDDETADEVCSRTSEYLLPRLTSGQTDSLHATFVDASLRERYRAWLNQALKLKPALAPPGIAMPLDEDSEETFLASFLLHVARVNGRQSRMMCEYLNNRTIVDLARIFFVDREEDQQKSPPDCKMLEQTAKELSAARGSASDGLESHLHSDGVETDHAKGVLKRRRYVLHCFLGGASQTEIARELQKQGITGGSDAGVSNDMKTIVRQLGEGAFNAIPEFRELGEVPSPEVAKSIRAHVRGILKAFNRRARKTNKHLQGVPPAVRRETARLQLLQAWIPRWEVWQRRLAERFPPNSLERRIIEAAARDVVEAEVQEAVHKARDLTRQAHYLREKSDFLKEQLRDLRKKATDLREENTEIGRVREARDRNNDAINANNGRVTRIVEAAQLDPESAHRLGERERIWLALHKIHAAYADWMRTYWNLVDPRRRKRDNPKPSEEE